jgi:hypothetical protein
MPVAGQPRNPFGQSPHRFELEAPRHPVQEGRTPATMRRTLRGMILALGQIRHDWRQTVGYIDGPPPFSWTSSGVGGPTGRAFQVTRALRYLTRSLYMGAGIDNTRFAELHSAIPPQTRSPVVTTGGGQQRNKPVTRNRLTSFGARVPTLQERAAKAPPARSRS